MKRVLSGMRVVPVTHDKDEDYGNGGTCGGGNCKEDDDNNDDGVRKGKSSSSYSSCDVCAVLLVNLGTNHNLAKLFCFSSLLSASFPGGGFAVDIRCYVLDCHQLYHLANKYAC